MRETDPNEPVENQMVVLSQRVGDGGQDVDDLCFIILLKRLQPASVTVRVWN